MFKKIAPLLFLMFFILQISTTLACSPIIGVYPPLKFEAKDIVIRTSSLGPVYTNINDYTIIYTTRSSGADCGPFKTYAKTSVLMISLVLVGFVMGILASSLFRNKAIKSKDN
jgi:hypothetical protein